MGYNSQELSCIFSITEDITKSNVDEWIKELCENIYQEYLDSGEPPQHFQRDEIEAASDKSEAKDLLFWETWNYIRLHRDKKIEYSFIRIGCESGTDNADEELFIQIIQFIAKKRPDFLPTIRIYQNIARESKFEDLGIRRNGRKKIVGSDQCALNVSTSNLVKIALALQ